MRNDDNTDPMTKVLAWLAYAALGLAALLNAVMAGMALLGGELIGAIGTAGEHLHDDKLASSAGHAALIAKLVAVGFAMLAAMNYGAGYFLKKRLRTLFVPITCGFTIAGEAAFSVWAKHFTALDAITIACAVFAAWVWWKLPVRARPQPF